MRFSLDERIIGVEVMFEKLNIATGMLPY